MNFIKPKIDVTIFDFYWVGYIGKSFHSFQIRSFYSTKTTNHNCNMTIYLFTNFLMLANKYK